MKKKIDLVDLLEKNIEIERVFNQRLDKFNKDLEVKEQEIKRLEELIAKEKKQFIANKLFNTGTLQRNQDLNKTFGILKERIKKVYKNLDQNNNRLSKIINFIETNKQIGGGDDLQVMEDLEKIEEELKKNISRINYVEQKLIEFVNGKDVQLKEVGQILEQVLETPNNNQQTDKNFDQEAKKILIEIENIENKL